MSATRELVFDWLFNASVQIGLFAVMAFLLSPFIAKAKAKYQHCFYLAIFTLCLVAPVFNTIWQSRSVAEPQKQSIQGTEHSGNHLWVWDRSSVVHQSMVLLPGAKAAVLVLW